MGAGKGFRRLWRRGGARRALVPVGAVGLRAPGGGARAEAGAVGLWGSRVTAAQPAVQHAERMRARRAGGLGWRTVRGAPPDRDQFGQVRGLAERGTPTRMRPAGFSIRHRAHRIRYYWLWVLTLT